MKYKVHVAVMLAVFGGILLAIAYVNPYSGKILLSELVLQLSGSRGEFTLGSSLPELISLVMRMIPNYVFEIYFGTALYRHFCTASIYVFSRYPKRLYWYFNEVITIGVTALLYQFVLLVTVVLITVLRYQLQIDGAGIIVFAYHFILHAAWLYSVTLSVNLLAIWVGSSASFLTVVGIQIICITLLGCIEAIRKYLDIASFQGVFLNLNPIAHLVLGWHSSNLKSVNQVLNPPYPGLDLNNSLLFMIVICGIILLFGAVFIKRHDLLISDSEMGVL
jgi:hypothetical protein